MFGWVEKMSQTVNFVVDLLPPVNGGGIPTAPHRLVGSFRFAVVVGMTGLLAGPSRRYSYPGMGFRVTVLFGIHNQRPEEDSFRRGVARIPILSV